MQRRRLLQTIAVGSSLAVAGCVGGGDDGADSADTSDPEAGTNETDEEPDESEPTDESTAEGTDEESDDSTGGTEDESDETADQTDEESEEETTEPTLGELEVAFENNYRFSVSVPQLGEPVTGAFDDGNFYSVVAIEGDTLRTYIVDGQQYIVADGSCTPVPSSTTGGMDVSSLADADTVEQDVTGTESASLTPSGTTTIDGTRTYVYELETQDTPVTYYVGVESRRLRRVETQEAIIDYTDWGAVDPIIAPC